MLNELLSFDDEGDCCAFQVHLHPQLCPILQHNPCLCHSQFPVLGAIVDVTIPIIGYCIACLEGRLCLLLSQSIHYSNRYEPNISVDDAGSQGKGLCLSKYHVQQYLIKLAIIFLEGYFVGLDEEPMNMGSIHDQTL